MFKRSKVALAAAVVVAGGVGATSAWAQTEQRIEITGSRIKTLASEGASPVTTITAQEIKIDGAKNVESILNNLPQVFADQNSTVSNGASGTASVNLRGLGSSRTLVLVNGRRMPMGSAIDASPDLNEIPAGLIRRVDVLTGGASAVYGSDAVAGVVNFILDDRFQGVEVELNHSFYNHRQQNAAGIADIVAGRSATNPASFKVPGNKSSDGKSTSLSLLMGSNFGDSGNATLYVSYKKDDALLQSERDFSSCAVAAGAAGFSCGGSGTAATGRITNLADGKVWTVADAAGNARLYNGAVDAYNYGPTNYYQRPSERWVGRGSLAYDIAKTARAYANFSFHDDNTIAQVAPGGIFGNVETVKFDNPLLTQSWRTALGLVNPGDSTDVVVQRRNVEGGGRQSQYRNTSFRTEAGVKGDIGNWSYDVYGVAARVIYSQSQANYFLDPKIDKAFDVVNSNGTAMCASAQSGADPNCVPYNVWKLGGVTPAQLAYLQTPGLQKGSTFLEMLGATASADLGDYGAKLPWAKSGLGLSLGVESRREKLDLTVDDATLTGALSGSGGPTMPLSGGYGVKEAFGELRIPIAEGMPGANALAASLTARNSDYSTGKQSTTYGLGLEYGPIKEVKLRASVQRAIRAANLIEMFQAQGNNLFDMSSDPCSGAAPARSLADCQRTGVTPAQYGKIQDSPAKQYNYLQGGNPGLDPEKADSLTFGLALAPINNLTLTFDYFDIKVKEAIGKLDPTVILDKCLDTGDALFCKLVQRDRLGTLWLLQEGRIVATNQNLGSMRTTGWDFSASYLQRLGSLGSLTLNFNGTQLQKLQTEPIPGGGSYDCVGLYGSSKCGSPNPKWRHKLRGVWATPWDFDFAATWRHLDKVMQQETSSQTMLAGSSNPIERELSARDYLDLAAVWRATKSLSIMVGINNVLDRDPPITSQQGPSVFGNGNTFPGTYDALGRKVFLTGSYKF